MTPGQFTEYLRGVSRNVEEASFGEPLREMAEVIQQGFGENFARQEDAGGAPWPAHAESTIRRYGPHPLLVLTTAMRTAATGGSGDVADISDRDLAIGVSGDVIPYAAVHQHGSDRRNIPQRQYVYATSEVVDQCEEILALAGMDILFGA